MHIVSGNLGMESARRYSSSSYYKASFGQTELKEDKEEAQASGKEASKNEIIDLQERVESMRSRGNLLRDKSDSSVEEFRNRMVKYIYELLFGKERAEKLSEELEDTPLESNIHANANEYTLVPVERIIYSSEYYYHEEETTSFSTQGIVKTADGREISINVDVTMSRSFTEYVKEELKVQSYEKVYDPLVINFSGNTAKLTDQKFFFDIDMDGKQDEIARLGSGSGYLALDKNHDGVINDGSELFGPKSGDGFGDLSEYDEDGNGWIDEGDSIWQYLKIWCQNEDGTSTLYRLSDKNVGAICLQNTKTQYTLADQKNCELGYIRASGVFLFETGEVGTVQHLDLVQ
ncbi:MAG: hypothetical protein IJZ82_11840 [Lachnospiraceae bacterium]|nr:hypothetical protein [Lachnospiraceae bacterium]